MRKFIITAELRDITDRWDNTSREDSISYSKMVELINEKALKYAQEYADSKWVSVEERLPDEKQQVLAELNFASSLKICQCVFVRNYCTDKTNFKNVFVGIDGGLYSYLGVTHWQPLPNPPKQ